MTIDAGYEEPYFFYGNLLVDQGKNAEAIPYLRTAIKDRNDYVPAPRCSGTGVDEAQKWQEAKDELNQTIALDRKHPQPHLLLSQIFPAEGDEAKAREEKDLLASTSP